MADQNNNEAKAAADAPAKVAETTANTAQKLVDESRKTAKRTRATATRRAKRANAAAAPKAQQATRRAAKAQRSAASARATKTQRAAASAVRNERIDTVNTNNLFAGFGAFPAAAPFQSFFANANERGQDTARRSQQVAGELADIARGNVEALVEASRVAAEGARSIGQDVVAKTRDSVEEAADAIRSLAEAKSPTEFVQLQSEIARGSFDRFVAESSRLTESFVKLAGEAIQPISNRATANAERINSFVA
jgi:phasin family protein